MLKEWRLATDLALSLKPQNQSAIGWFRLGKSIANPRELFMCRLWNNLGEVNHIEAAKLL